MSKKSAARQPHAEEKPKSLEQMILDKLQGKYELVSLASGWALELRRREENKHLSQAEILDLALSDILTGKADMDAVRAAASAAASAAEAAIQASGKVEKEKK